jgi:death-on-curing protein
MTDWRWVAPTLVYAVHDRLLAEHGGLDGIQDKGAVESALARPQDLAAYGEPDAAALAAAYAFGLARNHGFADGNKRTAWITARVFLADNGLNLRFAAEDAVRVMERLAAGQMTEEEMAAWFRERLV